MEKFYLKFILVIYIIIIIFLRYEFTSSTKDKFLFSMNITIHRSIFVAIMTGGARIRLIEKLYDIWLKDFLSKSYCDTIKLYSTGVIPNTNNLFIKESYVNCQIPSKDISRNHLCAKLYIAINDFLNNSKADWFLRLCDDTFINMNAFDSFFTELNLNTDPIHDKLVQGHCIHKHRRIYSYIQGGSGILFSRKSAIELNNTYDHFSTICLFVKNDDTSIGCWLHDRNYTFKSMTNRFFVGHQFQNYKKITDILSNTSNIEKCPTVFPTNSYACRSFIINLKNITFWHDRVHFLQFLPFARNFISNLPDNLYFYIDQYAPRVCRGFQLSDRYLN